VGLPVRRGLLRAWDRGRAGAAEINTDAMNLHLAKSSRCVAPGTHAVVNPDRAAGTRSAAGCKFPTNAEQRSSQLNRRLV
jgi:hypothetical protein